MGHYNKYTLIRVTFPPFIQRIINTMKYRDNTLYWCKSEYQSILVKRIILHSNYSRLWPKVPSNIEGVTEHPHWWVYELLIYTIKHKFNVHHDRSHYTYVEKEPFSLIILPRTFTRIGNSIRQKVTNIVLLTLTH